MAYKFKPNKAVLKRFRFTKTGKVKRNCAYRSHLLSGRDANQRRRLRQPAILSEREGKRMRLMVGLSHLNPVKTACDRKRRAELQSEAAKAQAAK